MLNEKFDRITIKILLKGDDGLGLCIIMILIMSIIFIFILKYTFYYISCYDKDVRRSDTNKLNGNVIK